MKKSTKITTLLLCLLFSLLVFAGCSGEAANYLKLGKEVASLDSYSFDGTIDIGIDYQPAEADPETQAVLDKFSEISLDYSGEVDMTTSSYHMNMDFAVDGQTLPLEFYLSPSKMLVNAQQFVDFVNLLGEADEAAAAANEAVFADVKWIDLYDDQAMLEALVGLENIDYSQINQLLYDLIDQLANGSFKDYQPEIFGTQGNGYTMTIKADQLKPLSEKLTNYILDNYDAIMADLTEWCQTIPDSVLTDLGLSRADLNQILADLDVEITDQDKAQIISQINTLCEYVKGSEYSVYYEKTGANRYKSVESMILNLSAIVGEPFSISIDATTNINGSKAVSVVMPTEGISSIDKMSDGKKAAAVSGTFYLEDKTINWYKNYDASILDHGGMMDVEPLLRNNLNYFPLRQIGELFDETVVWDQKTGEIYVLQGEKKILMTGMIVNNRTYVKLRDFEKLGYTISYTKDELLGGIATFNK